MGASAGLTLWYVGLLRSDVGRSARAALMAACTSRAAPSMSRFRPTCTVIRAEPTELCDVISATSAIEPRCRSSGLATLVATVSGLGPGKLACTEMVGKSTCGGGAHGRLVNANKPASAMPIASSVVATGRAINGCDRFMPLLHFRRRAGRRIPVETRTHAAGERIEAEINYRRGEKRERLRHDQTTHNRDPQRTPEFRPRAPAEHQWQRAEKRGHGRHQDGPETQQTRLIDSLARRFALLALGFKREVDHHDGVFLHDPDQQHNANDPDDVQIVPGNHQRKQRADAGGGQRGKNRDWMDEALVQHAQ